MNHVKLLLAAIMAVSAADAAAAAAPVCTALPGVEMLRDGSRPDFVIMGEAHGTTELPAAFADLVCAYAATGAPLTVGLEFLPGEQAALDAYFASNGDDAARAALLSSPAWSIRDGRASQAIFALIESLRKIRKAHSDLVVVAFDHASETPGTSAVREKGMADLLLAAKRARPRATVLAFTGIGHAGKTEWTSFGPPFPAMSQHLPGEQTVALSFSVEGGEIWACQRSECGPQPVPVRHEPSARGLTPGSSRKGFDATVSVGSVFSPSAPARTER